jgi:hypothetical protein
MMQHVLSVGDDGPAWLGVIYWVQDLAERQHGGFFRKEVCSFRTTCRMVRRFDLSEDCASCPSSCRLASGFNPKMRNLEFAVSAPKLHPRRVGFGWKFGPKDAIRVWFYPHEGALERRRTVFTVFNVDDLGNDRCTHRKDERAKTYGVERSQTDKGKRTATAN